MPRVPAVGIYCGLPGKTWVISRSSNRLENVLRAESLDRFLDSVVIRPGTHIVLDLTKVRFFSSAVFSKLINLKRRVGTVGGRFSIRNVDSGVLEAMRITHLDHVFDMEV